MNSRVCVDASLVLRWLLPTEQDSLVDSLLDAWDAAGTTMMCPPMLDVEVTSVIRRNVYLNKIQPQQGEEAYRLYREMGVTVSNPPGLSARAWALATQHNQSQTSKMQYVALAELEDCDLWTADTGLASLRRTVSRIKWLGEVGDKSDVARDTRTKDDTPEPAKAPLKNHPPALDDPGLWRRI